MAERSIGKSGGEMSAPLSKNSLLGKSAFCHSWASEMQTAHLILEPHHPQHLLALLEGPERYESASGTPIAEGLQDFLRSASPDYLASLRDALEPDEWKFGYAIIERESRMVVGLCGFAAAPDTNGAVEIAYGIAPSFQGRGYATEAAQGLIEIARRNPAVRLIRAHTLAERNASTRVLEKCGFRKVGELWEEDYQVWRWEK
jgi:ribosomal-protein-alanine N-acetyltransferase